MTEDQDEAESACLFDDMPDDVDGFEISNDLSDLQVLHGIWTRGEIGDLAADEGWAILYDRYPSEPRFLLLSTYEELAQPVAGVWTPVYFLNKVLRVRQKASAALEQRR